MGIGASVLCALHCTLLPLIATSFTLFGINLVHHEGFDWIMIVIAFAIGAYTLRSGYLHHKSLKPIFLFCIGFGCLVLRLLWHELELWLLLPAVVFIIWAHLLNFRLSKACVRPGCAH